MGHAIILGTRERPSLIRRSCSLGETAHSFPIRFGRGGTLSASARDTTGSAASCAGRGCAWCGARRHKTRTRISRPDLRAPGCAASGILLARPNPRRPHNRNAGRFGVARRQVDQQPLDLPGRRRLEVFRDEIAVPVLKIGRRGFDDRPNFANLDARIAAEDDAIGVDPVLDLLVILSRRSRRRRHYDRLAFRFH
jgi:hypothetical protein